MPFLVKPLRRRLIMVVLLALAAAGGVIRATAPDPSTLRDVGSLLLVLWLPAVGNLVAFVLQRLPARRPAGDGFAQAPFAPQLHTHVDPLPTPAGWLATLDPQVQRCTIVAGRRGFSARSQAPVASWLAGGAQPLELQCLTPSAALRALPPGTHFHLLVGTTAVARGRVLGQIAPTG